MIVFGSAGGAHIFYNTQADLCRCRPRQMAPGLERTASYFALGGDATTQALLESTEHFELFQRLQCLSADG